MATTSNDSGLFSRHDICNCCLCCDGELFKINVVNVKLSSIFQENQITLCSICKRSLEHFEVFIDNVNSVHDVFVQHTKIKSSRLHQLRRELKNTKKLQKEQQEIIHLDPDVTGSCNEEFKVYSRGLEQVEVKLETIKQEDDIILNNHFDHDFSDDNQDDCDIQADLEIKDENVTEVIKCEYKNSLKKKCKGLKAKRIKKEKKHKTRGVKVKVKSQHNLQRKDTNKIELIHLSPEESAIEREQMRKEEKYLNLPFKCESCIKGFIFKSSYDKHIVTHQQSSGDNVCDICNQRKDTLDKLKYHMKSHTVRYKCKECSVIRNNRRYIIDHYTTAHATQLQVYYCQHCPKSYKKLLSLNKHVYYAHRNTERVTCDYCQRQCANKLVLKIHMQTVHSSEVSVESVPSRHGCPYCAKAFRAPSLLRNHLTKHSDRKDYYCVECNKSFKSDTILKHHLKTAIPHVNYTERRYQCLHCDKRFSIKRDLDRHMNSVHLNRKPFQCDKCDRAYVNSWSLIEHNKLIHDGYKRPLKYPCPMCEKVFDRNQILISHIRTHTGERPYQCNRCPANFAQGSSLQTHIKLIHLKLTRDGRAKVSR